MELGKSNLEVFADTLLELGQLNKNLLVVTGDSRGSGKLVPFGYKLPEQIVEVGRAEQNLVGISAGLASTGKKVYAVPGAKIAEKLGKTLVANVVMLGALTILTKAVDAQALKKSIMDNVPTGTEELNLQAFEEGVKFAKNLS